VSVARKLRPVPLKRLIDANPRWHSYSRGEARCFVSFDCPIHEDCHIGAIPFTPSVEGGRAPHAGGVVWERQAGTDFDKLTISPSIHVMGERNGPGHCEWHGFITNGELITCPDSR
jgi:hypothetical protein